MYLYKYTNLNCISSYIQLYILTCLQCKEKLSKSNCKSLLEQIVELITLK